MAFWSFFIIFLTVTNIIGINSLIAIIGDSYDKTQVDQAFYDAVQKFGLLDELNNIYFFFKKYLKLRPQFVYIHIIRYDDNQTDQKKNWLGRIENMREFVQNGINTIAKQNTEMKYEF